MPYQPRDLAQFLQQHPVSNHCWVALSGGLDSVVLLHSLNRVKTEADTPWSIKALHINHQLSPNADTWQAFCEDLCQSLSIELHCTKVNVQTGGRGLEDAAREARYRVFEQALQAGDTLLTAHHQDDQAETLLLRLMRGAGPRGLGAMAAERPLGQGRLLRPLLAFSRAGLESYAREQGLAWMTDESNADIGFDRNYLRHEIMPLLQQRWPGFARRWQQSAALCRESDELLQALAAEDLQTLGERPERLGFSLDLVGLRRLSEPRRAQLLRYWLMQRAGTTPEIIHRQEIESQLINPRPDSEALVSFAGVQLRFFQQRLYLLPSMPKLKVDERQWALDRPLVLPGGGLLQAETVQVDRSKPRLKANVYREQPLTVRWRKGGERCKPVGRNHSQTLKKLLQEYALEPWLRPRVPLLYHGDKLVAVGDLWVCESHQANPGEAGLELIWRAGAETLQGDRR